jgi:UDP-glucose 4-epimerase
MRLLVTGGAGYVGSVIAAQLLEAGHQVVVLDDLSTGHADGVPAGAEFVQGSVREAAAGVLATGIDGVLHCAAKSLVGESVAKPALYWSSNLGGSLALLAAMREAGVRRIVFSSTAAVYGEPERVPIEEDAPARPTSPYGASKLAIDEALHEHARLDALGAVSLRYFNVAGAYREPAGGWLRERHSPETHLIPNVLKVAKAVQDGAAGGQAKRERQVIRIFGEDYPTPDGTCVRDYIHVADLGRAHLLALGACSPGTHQVYNLGSGTGFSVRQVLDTCREVTGVDIPAEKGARRDGDPAVLVASSSRIHDELGWKVEEDLRSMVADAWAALSASC